MVVGAKHKKASVVLSCYLCQAIEAKISKQRPFTATQQAHWDQNQELIRQQYRLP